jgi:hypothetical protein
MQRKCSDGNIQHGSLRTAFWGTQWGQLNRLFTLLGLLASTEWQLGSLRRLLAWYNSLSLGSLPAHSGAQA